REPAAAHGLEPPLPGRQRILGADECERIVKPGRHGNENVGHQWSDVHVGPLPGRHQNGEVELARLGSDVVGATSYAHLEVAVLGKKLLHSRQKPAAGKYGRAQNADFVLVFLSVQSQRSGLEQPESARDGTKIVLAECGDDQPPAFPAEQGDLEPFLQQPDLAADRAVRASQFLGGQNGAPETRRCLERPQPIHGRYATFHNGRKSGEDCSRRVSQCNTIYSTGATLWLQWRLF